MTSREVNPQAFALKDDGYLATTSGGSRGNAGGSLKENRDGQDWDDTMKTVQVPKHPIAAMQGPFAESLIEASAPVKPPVRRKTDASTRRRELLDQRREEDTHAAKWQGKGGSKYHELWKLMAQISFGIYLLLHGLAKDEEAVLTILQKHVDEVDGFLEASMEDFDLAIEDIEERHQNLRLPLENIDVFEQMLEDRQFRLQIVEGNERIEHIIHRTESAMNDAMKNVRQGLEATREMAVYLSAAQQGKHWREAHEDMQKVFEAMRGNGEGWYKAYVTLQAKADYLGQSLEDLQTIVSEMDMRAGEVSRRTRFSTDPRESLLAPNTHKPTHTARQQPSLTTIRSESSSLISSLLSSLPSPPAREITPPLEALAPPPPPPHAPNTIAPNTIALNTIAPTITALTATAPAAIAPTATGPTPAKPYTITRKALPIRLTPTTSSSSGVSTSSLPTTQTSPPIPQYVFPQEHTLQKEVEPPRSTQSWHSEHEAAPFILQPRTYSPQPPSPQPQTFREKKSSSVPNGTTEPVVPPKSTKRYSLIPTTYTSPKLTVTPPAASTRPEPQPRSQVPQAQSHSSPSMGEYSPELDHGSFADRTQSEIYTSSSPAYQPPQRATSHPQALTPGYTAQSPASLSPPHPNTWPSALTSPTPSTGTGTFTGTFTGTYIAGSPHSALDQQMSFHPVLASPHSPLQRPWTAAPPPLSQLRSASSMAALGGPPTAQNSNSGEKTLKKKRSAFGWFTNAFKLSEEERAAFEARRRGDMMQPGYYENQQHRYQGGEGQAPMFVQGRRVR